MNLTKSEKRELDHIRGNRKRGWGLKAISISLMVLSFFCWKYAGHIFELVDIDNMDKDSLLLFKSVGWNVFGLFCLVMGVLFISTKRNHDHLIERLYERVMDLEDKLEILPNQRVEPTATTQVDPVDTKPADTAHP